MRLWKKFWSDESGPTVVEYALLLGLIVVVSTTTLGRFGTGMHNIYTVIDTSLPSR